jgi:hypothetical protein
MVSKHLVYQARTLYKEVRWATFYSAVDHVAYPYSCPRGRRLVLLQLHHLGKDYPDPSYNFQKRLRGCFTAASGKITNDEEMQAAINKAAFVKKEVEALIFLSKYRSSA